MAVNKVRSALLALQEGGGIPQDPSGMAGNGPPSDFPVPGGTQRPSGPAETSGGDSDVSHDGFDALAMLKNAPESFATNVKAVLWDLPKAAVKTAIHYAKNPDKYLEDFKLLARNPKSVWKVFKDDYNDYYFDGDFGREFTEDPFRAVSDFAGLAGFGGGTAAAGATKAAQLARASSRPLARAASAVGRGARAVAAVEKYDPVSLTFKGAGKVFKPIADAMGITPETPMLRSLDAAIVSEGELEGFRANLKIDPDGITPEVEGKLIRALAMGEVQELKALAGTDRALFRRFFNIRKAVNDDSAKFLDETGAVGAQAQERALIQQYQRYKKQLDNVDIKYDDAKKLYDSKAIRPTFLSIYGPGRANDFFSVVNDPLYHAGSLRRAMQRAMKGEVPTDVKGILANQIRASIGARGNIKLTRSALEALHQKGLLMYVSKNSDPNYVKSLQAKGYARFEGPFFKSYFETFDTAVNALGDAMRQPGDPIRNVANVAEGLKERLTVAKEMLANPAQEVWAPRGVVAWMNMRLNPAASDHMLGKLLRWGLNAGGLLPYYKAIATVLNPRYWIANAVGDAALAVLYGLHPNALRYASKLRELVPTEIADIPLNKLYQSQYNKFTQVTNKFQHYAQAIDNYFKRATYIDAAAKEGIRRGLIKVGADFFATEESLKPFLMQIQNAPQEWANLLANITRGKEGVLSALKGRVEQEKKKERAGAALSKAASREGPKGPAAADDVYGGAEPVQGGQYDFEGTNDYKVLSAAKKAAEKEIKSLGDEITVLDAIKAGREESLDIDPRDLISKGDMDMLEALAFSPEAANRLLDRLIRVRQERIKVLQSPENFIARKTELPAAEDVSWEGAGFTGPEKVTSQYTDSGMSHGPTPAQAKIADRQKLYDSRAARVEQLAADELHRLSEVGKLEALVPGAERQAAIADRAIESANRFYGSYTRLTPWEKKIVREFVPFYTFTKAMTMLAFRWPFMMPRRQFMYLNLWRAWQDIMDDNTPRSSWARSLTPVMALENGDVIAIRDGSFSPMAGVRMTGVGGFEVPTVLDIFGQNPVVRLLMTARGQVTPKPLTPGTKATRLDNGEVWEWTGKGWRRVVLQPSVIKQLWSLFPQAQVIDALTLNAVQEEAGFALRPIPIAGPDGTPLYPVGWQERLLSTVLPTTRINPEQLEQREQSKIRQIVMSYQDDLRRSTPARREQIMSIFRKMQEDSSARYRLTY